MSPPISSHVSRASVWFRRSWHIVLTVALVLLAIRIERSLGDARAADEYVAQLQRDFPASEQARQLNRTPAGG